MITQLKIQSIKHFIKITAENTGKYRENLQLQWDRYNANVSNYFSVIVLIIDDDIYRGYPQIFKKIFPDISVTHLTDYYIIMFIDH